jgi:deoxyribonuclease-4
MKDYIGAHMSISGGIFNAPERGVKVGCGVIQVFTQNANQWRGKPVSDSDAALFREKWEASGLHEIVSHDIYLINLGAPPGEVRDKSLAGFREEMERCTRLGIGSGRRRHQPHRPCALPRLGRPARRRGHLLAPGTAPLPHRHDRHRHR